MKKEIITCIIIAIFILVLNSITQNYNNESVEDLQQQLEHLKTDILNTIENNDDDENLINEFNKILENWKNRYEKLTYFIEHDELEKVETEFNYIKANLETKQYEQAVPNVENSIFILEHIKQKFALQLKNIF